MSKLNKIWGKFTSLIKETKILLQLPIYEIEDCETKYESMAAKGWHLKRRDAYFDCYKRGKPSQQRYRLVFCEVKVLRIQKLTDSQLDSYSENGWVKVCERAGVYVFSAPKNGQEKELYTDAQEHIKMLKSVHNYVGGFGIIFASIIVAPLAARLLFESDELLSLVGLYEADWLIIAVLVGLLYIIWKQCYGVFRSHALVRQLKKGNPLRVPKEDKSKHLIYKVINSVLCVLLCVCLVGTTVMAINRRKEPLPEAGSNVPYLLGEDFLQGTRSDNNWLRDSMYNKVEATHGLLSDHYNTHEYIELNNGPDTSIFQDCFILHGNDSNTIHLAELLAENSIFKAVDDFEVIQYAGSDYVLTGPYTVVAVKGQRVIRITYIGGNDVKAGLDSVLNALADKWK